MTRRQFLYAAAAAAPAIVVPPSIHAAQRRGASRNDPWVRAAAIARRIMPPHFPARDFEITKFGAVGDGEKSCTEAIRKAIAACRQRGGGRVVVPDGRFLTGAIRLENDVNLHLSPKATLAFTNDTREYPIVFTRWEGMELLNFSPFIYALGTLNIAITGTGTLDGQANAERWWDWRAPGPAAKTKQAPARALDGHGGARRPRVGTRLWRGAFPATKLRAAVPLGQRVD